MGNRLTFRGETGWSDLTPSPRYRLHLGRVTITLIRNPRVRFGGRWGRDFAVPHIGVVTFLRRTKHPGAHRYGLERVR